MSEKNYFKQKIQATQTALESATNTLKGIVNNFKNDPERFETRNEYHKAVRQKNEYEEKVEKLRQKERWQQEELKRQEAKENRKTIKKVRPKIKKKV